MYQTWQWNVYSGDDHFLAQSRESSFIKLHLINLHNIFTISLQELENKKHKWGKLFISISFTELNTLCFASRKCSMWFLVGQIITELSLYNCIVFWKYNQPILNIWVWLYKTVFVYFFFTQHFIKTIFPTIPFKKMTLCNHIILLGI